MVEYIFIFSLFLNERQHVTGQVSKSYSWLSTLIGQKQEKQEILRLFVLFYLKFKKQMILRCDLIFKH